MGAREGKTAVVERWFELVDNGEIPEIVRQVDDLFTEGLGLLRGLRG